MIDFNGNYKDDNSAYENYGGKPYARICKFTGYKFKEAEMVLLVDQNGIEGLYEKVTFNSFTINNSEQRNAKALVQKYTSQIDGVISGTIPGKKNLFLYGSVGTGKTLLASAAVNALSNKGIACLFTSAGNIFDEIKKTFKSNEITEQEVLQKYKTVKILVIDDLAKEKATKWSNDILFKLIDYRCSHGLGTIVTTNHAPEALEDRLIPSDDIYDRTQAEAILSRLLGSAYQIAMYWDDYRFNESA